jgi:hypothetical protein
MAKGLSASDLEALREAFYAEYGDHAAHNTQTGAILGFTPGATGFTFGEPEPEGDASEVTDG